MSFIEEEISRILKEDKEARLEQLSDLSQDLNDIALERKHNGAYNVSFSQETYFLICEAVKNYLLDMARDLQLHEANKSDTPHHDGTLTADDFTDLNEIYRDYSGTYRTTTYIFTCRIQGEPNILTYESSLHDDDVEGFTIHTEKDDIWNDWNKRIGWRELEKLERKLKSVTAFNLYVREINKAESQSDLINQLYSLWDDDDPNLMPEQREQIEQMIDQKTGYFQKSGVPISNESWIFDLTDPTERYAIYELDTGRLDGDGYSFMSLDYVKKHGMKVQAADYYLAYGGVLNPEETLDSIYEKFNLNRPQDFTGHSLSTSDVVVLNRGGEVKAYYVDSFGFKELPDFALERQKIIHERSNRSVVKISEKDPESQERKIQPLRSMRMKR